MSGGLGEGSYNWEWYNLNPGELKGSEAGIRGWKGSTFENNGVRENYWTIIDDIPIGKDVKVFTEKLITAAEKQLVIPVIGEELIRYAIYPNYIMAKPYVRMSYERKSTKIGQWLTYIKGSEEETGDQTTTTEGSAGSVRTYAVTTATAEVDLTMEMGGRVWIDQAEGKNASERVANGLYEEGIDIPVPNMEVRIYSYYPDYNGSPSGYAAKAHKNLADSAGGDFTANPAKTDSNGEYKLTRINAMFKYTTEFDYNGQYYEPTIYLKEMLKEYPGASDYTLYRDIGKNEIENNEGDRYTSWRDRDWENSSKALDDEKDRDEFNLKFFDTDGRLINEGVNTNLRSRLIEEGKIDRFDSHKGKVDAGLPNGGNNWNIDPFMNQMKHTAYTCRGSKEWLPVGSDRNDPEGDNYKGRDYYPLADVFVIDEDPFKNLNSAGVFNLSEAEVVPLYGGTSGIDQMHHLNLGLVERELVDLELTSTTL